jgi:phospholipid/cholesterol/gamma-HCH transport system permease protein
MCPWPSGPGICLPMYYGYNAEHTAEGVGLATTRTVIASSVLVLIFDYMLTAAFL